jgi:hypothetical protein
MSRNRSWKIRYCDIPCLSEMRVMNMREISELYLLEDSQQEMAKVCQTNWAHKLKFVDR